MGSQELVAEAAPHLLDRRLRCASVGFKRLTIHLLSFALSDGCGGELPLRNCHASPQDTVRLRLLRRKTLPEDPGIASPSSLDACYFSSCHKGAMRNRQNILPSLASLHVCNLLRLHRRCGPTVLSRCRRVLFIKRRSIDSCACQQKRPAEGSRRREPEPRLFDVDARRNMAAMTGSIGRWFRRTEALSATFFDVDEQRFIPRRFSSAQSCI